MRILFCDFLHWTFPRSNNALLSYLREKGVECRYPMPCEISHHSRMLLGQIPENEPRKEYKGFDIDSLIKTETTMESGWYDIKVSKMIKYRKWARFLIDWAIETFEKEKPDYIIVEGGLTYLSRPILEVAREMGIGIIAIENSFIKGKIFIEFSSGYIVNRHSFARTSQDWIDTRVLTKERKKEVNKIIKSVFKHLNYKTTGKLDLSLKYEKTLFVPLQVYADQVTVYDSQFNNESFITEILKLARTTFSDWNVILKCHPKEERNRPKATGNYIESLDLPENVTLLRGTVDSVNTQELMKLANLIIVNNSQAGLEACLLEKPVVVMGDAFYARKGFTCDYHPNFDWEWVKANFMSIPDIDRMKIWFLYFFKWLYNKQLTDSDKLRINKELNLK